MIVLLILLLCVASFVIGRIVERTLMIRDLSRARRDARAQDQVALSELMRVLRGRAR